MATSHFHQIPTLMRYIEMLRPRSILDIGAGVGKWGFLCRDRLEFLEGRCAKGSWLTRIYGIELYEGYRNPIWDYCYDGFWVGDVLDVLDEAPDVELVLMGDVLTFLTKDRGKELLRRLAGKARYLLMSTPVSRPERSDGKHDQNPATAIHLSHWGPEDFSENWFVTERQGNTRFFLLDLHRRCGRHLVVEGAERNPFRALVRALVFKTLRKLGFPSGRFAAPRAIGEELSVNR